MAEAEQDPAFVALSLRRDNRHSCTGQIAIDGPKDGDRISADDRCGNGSRDRHTALCHRRKRRDPKAGHCGPKNDF